MLSPLPADTAVPAASPSRAAAASVSPPALSSGPTSGGSFARRPSSTMAHAEGLHSRVATSSSPVPLASPRSATSAPVST